MIVTIGAGVFPAFVTVLAFMWVFFTEYAPRGDYDLGTPLIGLLKLAGALIISLIAWLIWSAV